MVFLVSDVGLDFFFFFFFFFSFFFFFFFLLYFVRNYVSLVL